MTTVTTAEWTCTQCGSTNRKLVAGTVTESHDACVRCKTTHVLQRDPRPVRWKATAA